MDESLASVQSFVAGELPATDFYARLCSDDGLEALLNDDPHLQPGNYVGGSVYLYLLERDFGDPMDVLDAQGALKEWMDRNGIAYEATGRYEELHDLLLKAQPRWLDLDLKYLQEQILPEAGDRTGKELEKWLKAELPKRFRSVSKPPQWVQSAEWPISENGPLVFLGQLEVKGYLHDDAVVYVFHDPVAGMFQNVMQVG